MEIFYAAKVVQKYLQSGYLDELVIFVCILHVKEKKHTLPYHASLCDKDHVIQKNVCVTCLVMTIIVLCLFLEYGKFLSSRMVLLTLQYNLKV